MQKDRALYSANIPGLDLLRTIAILLVFFWHFQKNGDELRWLSWISRYGWTGVDLFFVLSGYLIASQLLKPVRDDVKPNLKAFYLKRAFRIFPAYLVIVAIYFLVPAWNESHGLQPLWTFLTFTLNFSLDRAVAGGFSHAWSLCVEEHFYLLFPPMVLLAWKMKGRISLRTSAVLIPSCIFLAGLVVRTKLWMAYIAPVVADGQNLGRIYDKIIYYPSYNRLDGLLVGVVIALLFTFRPKFKKQLCRFPNAPLLVGLILLLLACVVTTDRTSMVAAVAGFPLFALGFGGLVTSAILPNSCLNRIYVPGAAMMATLAYSFYLTHKEFIHLFRPALQRYAIFENQIAMSAAVFTISLIGASLLYVTVERPFLKLRNHFTTCETA